MAEVVELRVHGVGGTPAEGLLGTAEPDDLVQVGGDVAAPFMARRKDPLVEGYVWGKLTSKGLLQPLWLLLLPFTLVNVAGWTHPPERDARFRRTPLAPLRTLIHVVSFGLTATYVLWLGNITVNGLLGLDTLFGWSPTRTVKIGPTTIQLRRTTPRNMATAGRLSGLLIQAFRELGKENITESRIKHLKQTLPAKERRELLKDIKLAPAWMHPIFRSLAEERP